MDKNDLELLELYMDMVEKQDEIIERLTGLLKNYARELQHLRSVNAFFEVEQSHEAEALEECMNQYEKMRG